MGSSTEKIENMKTAIDELCKIVCEQAKDTERLDWMEAHPREFALIYPGKCATWREAIDKARS